MRRWPYILSALTFLVIGVVLLMFYFAAQGNDARQTASSLAEIANLPLAFISLLLSLTSVWLTLRQQRPGTGREDAVAVLAARIASQWQEEVGNRGLRHPRPLRLRWQPARAPVASPAVKGVRQGALVEEGAALPASRLVEEFRKLQARQLLIIGVPGAGKSTLALLFTMAFLDSRRPADAVPVLLPVSSWRPAEEPFRAWVSRRIAEDYSELSSSARFGPNAPARLVAENKILPVLDGLDEMPPGAIADAVHALNGEAGLHGAQMVITCRVGDYHRVIEEAGRLTTASAVEIEKIKIEDAIKFLTGDGDDARWSRVIAAMRSDREGPLATALSTPLMTWLAREVYRPIATDPGELADMRSVSEVEDRLLSGFLPSTYRDRGRRWLTTLARHLEHRLRDPNFAWWQLRQAVPRWLIGATVTALVTLGAVTACGLLQPFTDRDRGANMLTALLLGMPAGILVGLNAARSPTPATRRPRGAAALGSIVAAVVRDAATAAIACASLWAILFVEVGALTRGWETFASAIGLATFAIAIAVPLALTTNALRLWRNATPVRVSPRPRELVGRLLSGFGAGMIAGIPIGALVGTFAGIHADSWDDGVTIALQIAIAVAAAVGFPVGIGRWLTESSGELDPPSPRAGLRGDLILLLLIAVCSAIPSGFAFYALTKLDSELLTAGGLENYTALEAGSWGAFCVFGLVLLGSGSHWVAYTISRIWLAALGRLPWRPIGFLELSYRKQILRQAGAVYQFRHARLQNFLARSDGQPAKPVRASRLRTVRRRAVNLLAATVVVAIVGTQTVPALREIIAERVLVQHFHYAQDLTSAAGRIEGTDPDSALRLYIAAAEIGKDTGGSGFTDGLVGAIYRHRNRPLLSEPASFSRVGYGWVVFLRSYDRTAMAWDVKTDPPRVVKLAGDVADIQWSDDGFIVVVRTDSNQVTTWDVSEWPPRSMTLPEPAREIDINPSGTWAAVKLDDGRLAAWDLSNGQLRRSELAAGVLSFDHESWVLSHNLNENTTAAWNLSSGSSMTVPTGSFNRMSVDKSGRWIIFADKDRLRLWSLLDPAAKPADLGENYLFPTVTDDGRWLFIVRREGQVTVWDSATGQPRPLNAIKSNGRLSHGFVLGSDANGHNIAYDLSGAEPRRIVLGTSKSDGYWEVTEGGRWLIASGDPEVLAWDLKAEPPVSRKLAPSAWRHQVTGRWVVTFTDDEAAFHDVETWATYRVTGVRGVTWYWVHEGRAHGRTLDGRAVLADLTAQAPAAARHGPPIDEAFWVQDHRTITTQTKHLSLWDLPLIDGGKISEPVRTACAIVGNTSMNRELWERQYAVSIPYYEICKG